MDFDNSTSESMQSNLALDFTPQDSTDFDELHFKSRRTAIVLCTFNGDDFLASQLQSLYQQTDSNFALYVSDDGSQDQSCEQAVEFANTKSTRFLEGKRQGFCRNFLDTLAQTETSHQYYAFCDQDDVWYADKLERAIARLETVPKHTPALYCSRTEIIDAHGDHIGESPLFAHPPSFSNALVQNIGGGNTMVMNRAARDLVVSTVSASEIVSHDWWTYIVVTGAGGTVFYDPQPTLGYRQHTHNLVGANQNWKARARRVIALLQGRFKQWNTMNSDALARCRHVLTDDSQKALAVFNAARTSTSWRKRLFFLRISGLYRQTPLGNLGLIVAAAIGKL